ncbi:MAG TPA: GNAT family N-acetyltransferase [Polyangia bacterium]|jgi:GNAT superfamily N-acetyltransferase|nr:GNAT family N-acetyltransferase [Polyangia bacterium]
MSDLLVRLYALPPLEPAVTALAQQGIEVRRALAHERPHVTKLAREHGSEGWVAECDAAFARMPLACFVAVERATSTLLGFACYEATCRDFFGPELVHPGARGRGVGTALVLAALHAMRAQGYAYAIIGWASSVDFYRKAVGATVIDGSQPGIYPPALKA